MSIWGASYGTMSFRNGTQNCRRIQVIQRNGGSSSRLAPFFLASDEWLIRFIEPGSFGSCSRSLTSQGRVSRVGQRSVADSLRSIRFPTSHDRVSHAKVLKTNNLADVPTDRWFLFQCDQDGPTTVGFKVECRRATDVEYGTEFGRLRVEWTAAPVDLHAEGRRRRNDSSTVAPATPSH